jgi:hypothetical protein
MKVLDVLEEQSAALAPSADAEPLFAPLGEALLTPKRIGRRRWFWIGIVVAFVVAIGAGGAVAWMALHHAPDFRSYDRGVQETASIAASVQVATGDLRAVSNLPAFGRILTTRDGDLSATEAQARSLPDSRQREVLLAAVNAERAYLAELERLVSLSPKARTPGQLQRVSSLAHTLDGALAAAILLHATRPPLALVSLDPTALTRLASVSHFSYVANRARLAAANRARIRQLVAAQSFATQTDAIMSRYSSSRTDLSNWIADVNAYGATYDEAYGQLSQQSQVRSQLRSELASFKAPLALVADQQGLLAVIDRAVNAMNAAVQGISQYQTGSYGSYSSYDQTPGWQQFESESAAVTQQYADASTKYQSDKAALLSHLHQPLGGGQN